jgi:uncharacterized SAM-binding protein YcdF (DUF218 family)
MRHFSVRKLLVRGLRAATAIITTALLFFALVCVMVVVQSQHDETRPAGAAIVVDSTSDGRVAAPALDRVMLLHRRGTIGRIILAGSSDMAAAQRYLTERGVPGEVVVLSEPEPTLTGRLEQVAGVARANGIAAVLLVAEPPEMLRSLKIAHDSGLIAYASPTPSPLTTNNIRSVLQEGWAYITYLFIRA